VTSRSDGPDTRSRHAPAIVFGSSVTALGVIRALHAHDVATYVVAPPNDIATRSAGAIALERGWAARRSDDQLRTFLSETRLDRGVLFACGDDWLRTIAKMLEGGVGAFTSSMPASSAIEKLLDKGSFARTLEELGIEHPRTFEVRASGDLAQVNDDELASFFLKPRDSQRFSKEFGRKALALEDRGSAARQLERAIESGHEMLLQEWIPGPPTNHVFVDGFVDRNGRIVGLLARRRNRMYPLRFGNSTDSVTIPLGQVEDAIGSIRRLLGGIDYRGLFDAEFKRDPSTGRHKLIEVNARAWWQVGIARAAGVDLVHMSFLDALGLEVAPAGGYRIGRRWVHTFPDLEARWEALRSPGSSFGRRDRSTQGWFSARHAILQWSDPRPGFAEVGRVARLMAKRALARRPDPER
jgi:D-aspartate ligase